MQLKLVLAGTLLVGFASCGDPATETGTAAVERTEEDKAVANDAAAAVEEIEEAEQALEASEQELEEALNDL